MQPANDNLAVARELWEAVRELEKQDRNMQQHSKINQRKHDYEIVLMRNDQVLLKYYGEPRQLVALAEIWESDFSCNQAAKAADEMGLGMGDI